MMTRAIILMMIVSLCCIARLTFADGNIYSPPINIETESGIVVVPLAKLTMAYSRGLLPANVSLRAKVRLPFDKQEIVSSRQPLMLGSMSNGGATVFTLPQSSANFNTFGNLKLPEPFNLTHNLLDADELWLTYRSTSKSAQCRLAVDIEASGIPFNKSGQTKLSPAIPLKLSSRYEQTHSVNIRFDDSRILPRQAAYLLKRQVGMSKDPNWHVVEESNRSVLMRLLRLDLRDIDSIELEMRETTQQVNFRLSRLGNGKPTDVLTWNSIPKKVMMHDGKRWVRLYLAHAIKQQIPEALKTGAPLDLVELIAFVPKGAESRAIVDIPINNLKANYASPLSAGGLEDIKLPAQIEKTGSNKFLMRIDLATLYDAKFAEIDFLKGRVVPDNVGCVSTIESAELVNLSSRNLPSVLANIQNLARTWGGPFGLLHDESDDIELPKFLAHHSFIQISDKPIPALTVHPGSREVWFGRSLNVSSHGISPPAVSLDTDGLQLKGAGDIELSWHTMVSLPAHAYLALRTVTSENTPYKAKIRLRFTSGDTETLPYTLGEAFSLHKFAGRNLVGAEVLLHLPEKDSALSISKIGLFTINVVKVEQALKETLIANHMLSTYTINLGSKELIPKQPKEDFWRDITKGQVWLDYGDTHWGGGEPIPVLAHLSPMLGQVNEWRFSYQNVTDTQLQTWLTPSSPNTPTASPSARWIKLGLFILLAALAIILWHQGLLHPFAATVLFSLFQLKHQLSRSYQLLGKVLWNFLVAQRQVINLVVVLFFLGGYLFCQGRCSANPFFQGFTPALIIITSFAMLNIWRWRLQQGTSRPIKLFLGRNVNAIIFQLGAIGIVTMVILSTNLHGMVNQLLIEAEINNISQFVSDNGFTSIIYLIGIIMSVEIQTLNPGPLLLIAVLYGIAPWLGVGVYRLTMPSARLARWLTVAFGLYVVGITHIGQPGGNYYFTLGGISGVIVWRIWLGRIRGKVERSWPAVAEKVYRDVGSIYFSGALVGLAITALLMISHLELLAEQVAIIVYYFLIAGTALELMSMRRESNTLNLASSQKQPEI